MNGSQRRKIGAWRIALALFCGWCCFWLWFIVRQAGRPEFESFTNTLSVTDLGNGRIVVCRGGGTQIQLYETKTLRSLETLSTAWASNMDAAPVDGSWATIGVERRSDIESSYYIGLSKQDIGIPYPTNLCPTGDGAVISGYRQVPHAFMSVEPGDPVLLKLTKRKVETLRSWDDRVRVTGPDYDVRSKQICIGLTSNNEFARDGGPTSWVELVRLDGTFEKHPLSGRVDVIRARWGPGGTVFALTTSSGGWTRMVCLTSTGEWPVYEGLEWDDFDIDANGRLIAAQIKGGRVELAPIRIPAQFLPSGPKPHSPP